MKEVTEFMKNRANFLMVEKSRFSIHSRRQVATNEPDMWLEGSVRIRPSGKKVVHPRATAFCLPRMPIRVKRSKEASVHSVPYLEKFNTRMPNLNPFMVLLIFGSGSENMRRPFAKTKGIQRFHYLKKTAHHALHGKIRTEGFLVERTAFLLHLFGPISKLPRFKRPDAFASLPGFIHLQFFRFLLEGL